MFKKYFSLFEIKTFSNILVNSRSLGFVVFSLVEGTIGALAGGTVFDWYSVTGARRRRGCQVWGEHSLRPSFAFMPVSLRNVTLKGVFISPLKYVCPFVSQSEATVSS